MFAFMLSQLLLVAAFALLTAGYDLAADGTAEIGAYHVQPGRCENIERTLRKRYYYFFRESIAEMTPQLDSTALCADDPSLTAGYSGAFDDKPYLVYSRCIYGTNTIRALCGTTNRSGKPTSIISPVQAKCPKYTRCKNLCATKQHAELANPYAPAQVQLAQCMSFDQWNKITQMYAPHRRNSPAIGVTLASTDADDGEGIYGDHADPKVPVPAKPKGSTSGYGHFSALSLHPAPSSFTPHKALSAMGFRKRSTLDERHQASSDSG